MDKELENIMDSAADDFSTQFNLVWTSTDCWDRNPEHAKIREKEMKDLYKKVFRFHIKSLFKNYSKEELAKFFKSIINGK